VKLGTIGMASAAPNLNGSQFYITTAPALDQLDGKHTIFGEVAEGFDVLAKINAAFVDDNFRPLQNVRMCDARAPHRPAGPSAHAR
jgi:peptidyl-prolyl cis-trans isomerase-like 4